MSALLWWLVLGVLIGWLIEWIIDWLYWRQRRQAIAMSAQVGRQADAERVRGGDGFASIRDDNQRLQAELSTASALAQQRQSRIDELEAQLARTLADGTQRSAGMDAPGAPAVLSAGDDSTTAARFAAVQPSREETASPVPPPEPAPATKPRANETLLLHEHEVPQPIASRRDPLIDINGIGPAYERKLFDAGVNTFAQLAALTAEQVRAIIAPQRWQEIDTAAWIAEARERGQKQAEP